MCLLAGGWSFGTQKFKVMSATRYSRQTFIYSAIPFLRDRHFDGLDVDWEYPKGSDDKKNFVLLLKGKSVYDTLHRVPSVTKVTQEGAKNPNVELFFNIFSVLFCIHRNINIPSWCKVRSCIGNHSQTEISTSSCFWDV